MSFNPQTKLHALRNTDEKRAIQALMDVIDDIFGFDFVITDGFVVEIQMVATGLTSIPRTFKEFPNLKKIQMQDNKIRRIKNLELCKGLKVVNLSNNSLESESLKTFTKLPQLEFLNIGSNKLTEIDTLKDCSNLISLNASKNLIARIPNFAGLNHLQQLDLSKNPIIKLENIHYLERLSKLTIIDSKLSQAEKNIIDQGLQKVKEYCAGQL